MCPVRYATGQVPPAIDTSSQLTQEMAVNSDGMMRMQFMRPIISNDSRVSSIIVTYLTMTCLLYLHNQLLYKLSFTFYLTGLLVG